VVADISMKLNAQQLRKSKVGESKKKQQLIKRYPIVLALDNVLDTYNIGSFFRLADAISAQKVCLCGPVVTPPNIKIHRASIGTWKWTNWQHYPSTQDCLDQLKKEGYQLVACELNKNSQPYNKIKYKFPLAIIAGNESNGLSSTILKQVNHIAEIPMHGINKSLNVLVATSILAYQALSQLN